jgi:hypothetical protein
MKDNERGYKRSDRWICGVGKRGCTSSVDKETGGIKRSYITWRGMLARCYDGDKESTYYGCTVCNDWLFFSNFEIWYDENRPKVPNVRWEIDKDAMQQGNRVYCPEYCVFIPKEVNNLIINTGKSRGKYPVGVSFSQKGMYFNASCSSEGVLKACGGFNTAKGAFEKYKEMKYEAIRLCAEKYYKLGLISKMVASSLLKYKIEDPSEMSLHLGDELPYELLILNDENGEFLISTISEFRDITGLGSWQRYKVSKGHSVKGWRLKDLKES